MALAYRSTATIVAGTGTSVTGTEPSGTAQNDILIALYFVDQASATLGIPAGWSSIFNGASSTNFRYNLCYIVRGASAPSLAFTHTGSVYRELHMLSFSGGDTNNPINASADGGTFIGNPPNPDPPSATATVANTLVLGVGIGWVGSQAGGWVAPSGYTIRTDNTPTDDGMIAVKSLASATSENPGAFSGAFNTTADGWQATVILAPQPIPTVSTDSVTSIASTTATGNGTVSSDGGSTITERGVCWSTSANPTTSNSKATTSGTTGSYSASLTGLTAGTTYHMRAYATNANGTGYGGDYFFTTTYPTSTSWIKA